MAKSDSSAVQKLIELANQKPLELDVDLDGLFADDGRKAKPALPPPRRSANAPMSPSQTVPPLPRTRAPVSTQTGFAAVHPPAASPIAPSRAAPKPRLGAPTEPVAYADLAFDVGDLPATQQTPRRGSVAPWILAGAFALGVGFAAVYIVAEGLGGAAPRPDQAIAAAPVVAPVAAPSDLQPADQAPAAAVAPAATATVGFVSTPAGATVVLVDNGTMTPLGKTPLTAPLAVGKKHEVLFTLEGRGTVLAHVDPATQTSVAVELGAGAEAAPAAGSEVAAADPVAAPAVAAPVAAPAAAPAAAAAPEPAREVRSERRARAERKPEKRALAREPAGKGTLMLGAKPPCEIVINGKATGLTTPQREIPLAAGRHTVTLVNKQHGIRKSFPITVGAGGSVKVVKDFTDLMK